MSYIIQVNNWHPHTLNKLMKAHYHAANRMKSGDAQMIAAYARIARVPKAVGRRKLEIKIQATGKFADPDAYYKSVNDALVTLGYLKDDSSKWVEITPTTFVRGKSKATTIILTDLYA